MLDYEIYKIWASAFDEGTYFKGNWSKNSKMYFISSDKKNRMIAQVKDLKKFKFIMLENYGEIRNKIKIKWKNKSMFEKYTFHEVNKKTKVLVEIFPVPREWETMFNQTWPKALLKLKEIIEK